ncbi:prenylated Rab acceptor protein 1 [Vespa velutina]|uniref:prenylated Rab acceptor protein 1 n=1 Tax=Vespa velutina TaxID=202808 RepID=UPI001FB2B6DF|nr:prenylated Rab acceptor protein 1 [Vespa velutina]
MQVQPPKNNNISGSNFLQLPQLQFNKLGYPQVQALIEYTKANIKPWRLFLNTNYVRSPQSVSILSKRIVKNIEYFQSNYLFVFIGLFIYCLITSGLLLLLITILFGIYYMVTKWHTNKRLLILGHRLTLAQLYALIGICSLPFFYLVGAGQYLFWVLGASLFLITLHATFYNIDSVLCPGQEELDTLVVEEV